MKAYKVDYIENFHNPAVTDPDFRDIRSEVSACVLAWTTKEIEQTLREGLDTNSGGQVSLIEILKIELVANNTY